MSSHPVRQPKYPRAPRWVVASASAQLQVSDFDTGRSFAIRAVVGYGLISV